MDNRIQRVMDNETMSAKEAREVLVALGSGVYLTYITNPIAGAFGFYVTLNEVARVLREVRKRFKEEKDDGIHARTT